MDENAVTERLAQIEEATKGALTWSDSAGVKNLIINTQESLSDLKFKWLAYAYKAEVR